MNNIISLRNIRKCFKTKHGILEVLKNITLDIERGGFTVILGQSGCGKSTLLNILGFMDHPTSGTYIFNGIDTAALTDEQKTLFRGETIGFVFQSLNLIATMTALENIELPLGYRGVSKSKRLDTARQTLERVGLSHRQDHYPSDMSGGEQQRVAIARAIVSNPLLILADEPTGNLDRYTAEEIMRLLKSINRAGTTIIMVTHDESLITENTHTIRMQKGETTQEK
ncbi:MAG: ABC transporter ATP-binding protein [Eubacteriales bacterium]|nr:ABC transporter ATP-binding protein [Eubacteriales bacterium]